jgi:hypothetical protein
MSSISRDDLVFTVVLEWGVDVVGGVDSIRCRGVKVGRYDNNSEPTVQKAPGAMLGNADRMLNARTRRCKKESWWSCRGGIVGRTYSKR